MPPVSETQSGEEVLYGDILSLPEAAAYFKIRESVLEATAAESNIPARRIAGEWWFFRRALEEWVRFPGIHSGEYWRVHPRWLFEAPFLEELLVVLEKRLLTQLRQIQPEERHPKPGSKQAVLQAIADQRTWNSLPHDARPVIRRGSASLPRVQRTGLNVSPTTPPDGRGGASTARPGSRKAHSPAGEPFPNCVREPRPARLGPSLTQLGKGSP